jgi:hypothetical protein
MPTNVSWNNTTYSIPDAGEFNWSDLSAFLLALGNNAQTTGAQFWNTRVVSAATDTLGATDAIVVCTNTGARTITLPAGTDGRILAIIDGAGNAASFNVTIDGNGSETINGSLTYVINDNYGGAVIAFDSTTGGWYGVASFVLDTLSNPMTTTGDIIRGGSAGAPTRLALGSANTVLTSNGTIPAYALLVNANIDNAAAIVDTKLATISTAGKVSGGAITSGTIGGTTAWNTSGNITSTGIATITNDDGAGGYILDVVNSHASIEATDRIMRLNFGSDTTPADGANYISFRRGTSPDAGAIRAFNSGIDIELNSNSSLGFATGGTSRMRIDSAGRVGIAGTPLTANNNDHLLSVFDGSRTVLFGADASAQTITNSTIKQTRLGVPHYSSSSEEPMALIFAQSTASANQINIGGNTGSYNAATEIGFYTAATQTTLTGTNQGGISSTGAWTLGPAAAGPSVAATIRGSANNGQLLVLTTPSGHTSGASAVGVLDINTSTITSNVAASFALQITTQAGQSFTVNNAGAVVIGTGTSTTHRLNTVVGTTVGAAGGASALPATPTGYITININGTDRKIPYYAT